MSKDQKKTIEIDVETVNKLQKIIEWTCSTLVFWKLNNLWPTNLIYDELSYINDTLYIKVSSSHIIDK